jgi:hypothetical protein
LKYCFEVFVVDLDGGQRVLLFDDVVDLLLDQLTFLLDLPLQLH